MENDLFRRLFRDAAPRPERRDDPDLQRSGLVDEEPEHPEAVFDDDTPHRRPIDERGVHEDSVAMPGGGQIPIDDLEDTGLMSDDLWRKARPDVSAYHDAHPGPSFGLEDDTVAPTAREAGLEDEPPAVTPTPEITRDQRREAYRDAHGMAPPVRPDLGFQSRARVYDPRTDSFVSHRGPAVDAYAHYVGDTDDMADSRSLARRERLYAHAVDEAGRKNVLLPEELPPADPSRDPIRRIGPGDTEADRRRYEYNRRHVSH
jgi:hypothetical protein